MAEPKIEVEIDDNLNASLVVTCPMCGRKIRQALKTARPGTEIRCICGQFAATLSGDDISNFQGVLDDLG